MIYQSWLMLILQMSAIKCLDKVIEDLLTPLKQMGETCGYASCPIQQKDSLNIHIVPHTHGELGGSRTFFEHYTGHDPYLAKSQINMKRILDFVITELYTHRERTFTLSDISYFFHWWANRDETVRRMVYMLIRQGRLNLIGGGWSMSDEATTSYHAVIDHFTYSLRKINSTFLECGRPLVAWQADCYGHSREFASLLSRMGFDGLFINPISFDDELQRMNVKGLEFVWRGSDDLGAETDIFTHKLFDGYWSPPGFCFGGQCSDPLIVTATEDFANYKERVRLFAQHMKHRQGPYYTTKNVLVMMGQKFGYYDASVWFANIDKLIVIINEFKLQETLDMNAFYSTPACYLKAVYEESPKLQTKQDDFFPFAYERYAYGTGYFTSRPSLKLLAREGHRFLQICKQLSVTAQLSKDYNKFFEDFSWINGVFQDHTIITGGMRPHVAEYYVAKMSLQINAATGGIIKDAFNKLRGSPEQTTYYKCMFNVSSCMNSEGPHYFVMVYNPLSWNVTVPVRLPILTVIYSVYDLQGNQVPAAEVPVPKHIQRHPARQAVTTSELVFYAVDVPPLGYRSYCIQKYYYGWDRPKRSLIKKINQNKPKKYLVRQTNYEDNVLFEDSDYNELDTPPKQASIHAENNEIDSPPKQTNIQTDYNEMNAPPNQMEPQIQIGDVSFKDYESRYSNNSDNDYESRYVGVVTPKSPIDTNTTETYTTENMTRRTEDDVYNITNFTTTTDRTIVTVTSSSRIVTETTTAKVTRTTKRMKSERRSWPQAPKGYLSKNSSYPYFNNKYIRVNLDDKRRVHSVLLANGVKLSLDIKFFYYVADDPAALGKERSAPGPFLFRTMDSQQEEIMDVTWFKATILKNKLVKEYHCVLSSYASYVIKLYTNTSVLEVDWVVGPVPVEDGLGKEVFIKYATNLENKGVFYTDSNGRQTIKRIRNMRPTFTPLAKDAIAGNMYPVTSKIHIEDTERNVRFAIFTDRAQGGSSLQDGEINLLVHRRLLTAGTTGFRAYLNETEGEKGLIVRGTHYLYISKANHRPTRIYEKKLAKEIELKPQIFVSDMYGYGRKTKSIWLKQNNYFSALKSKLPLGIHILTLEKWNEGTLLLRLENYLEKDDVVLSGVKTVNLTGLFRNFEITNIKETTLSAHMWLKDFVPLSWNKHKFLKNFNQGYGNNTNEYAEEKKRDMEDVDLNKGVVLEPQQIRTFVVWYELIK